MSALYNFTLPSIRASRVSERDDEPELSISGIRKFVEYVREAEVLTIDIESYQTEVERFSGCPAAVVVTRVRYNRWQSASQFQTIWVYTDGTWFTTALRKFSFGDPPTTSD